MSPWRAAEAEFQELSPAELRVCREARNYPQGVPAHQLEPPVLQGLYMRGLLFVEIRITGQDHVSIPPLEVPLRPARPAPAPSSGAL